MFRRYIHVSFGALCLVAACHFSAGMTRADWDPSLSGELVGASALAGGGPMVWNRNGDALRWNNESQTWDSSPDYDLPVPVEDVKLLNNVQLWCVLIARDDRVFWITDHGNWVEIPSPVKGPVTAQPNSWGSVKGLFRDAAR